MQVRQGRLNFTTMADIPEGAPVLTGIFSVLNYPAIILFDSMHHTVLSVPNLVPSVSYLFTTPMGVLQFLHPEAGLPPIILIDTYQ
jgi:thioredoxin-related protein